MLNIQRSIPIPRISLEKLINYMLTVGENPGIDCSTIKERGLDIGKVGVTSPGSFRGLGLWRFMEIATLG